MMFGSTQTWNKGCKGLEGKEDSFFRLFNYYKNIAINTYRWENLPNGIESRFIEEYLFNTGQVFFTQDKELGLISLPCSYTNQLNVYSQPTAYNVYGIGYNKMFKADQGVRIINNDTLVPTIVHIKYYVERMLELESVTRQNVRQQRFPYIISTTKSNEFTMKNLMRDIMKGIEAIFVDKEMVNGADVGINVIETNSPYLVDKFRQEQKDLECELLTFLGLNCVRDKKERMITDEANANNPIIEMSLDLGFKTRELACEQINAMFGLDIKVTKVIKEIEDMEDNSDDTDDMDDREDDRNDNDND